MQVLEISWIDQRNMQTEMYSSIRLANTLLKTGGAENRRQVGRLIFAVVF